MCMGIRPYPPSHLADLFHQSQGSAQHLRPNGPTFDNPSTQVSVSWLRAKHSRSTRSCSGLPGQLGERWGRNIGHLAKFGDGADRRAAASRSNCR
ncbi:hypothetical protein J6590_034640 [Homalodisca vitripennis]|nr:hypothetical protein J6590_034640 [Homalodisca vitripennis]